MRAHNTSLRATHFLASDPEILAEVQHLMQRVAVAWAVKLIGGGSLRLEVVHLRCEGVLDLIDLVRGLLDLHNTREVEGHAQAMAAWHSPGTLSVPPSDHTGWACAGQQCTAAEILSWSSILAVTP